MAFLVFLVLFAIGLFGAAVECRSKPPLLGDEIKYKNKAECDFGDTVRELGSQWIPDLGVPFGVLYCMRCECIKAAKKRRIYAKVECRNIKNECPELTCDEPVLLPGRCCKTCNGTTYDDGVQDIVPQNVYEDWEKNNKHFAALLTAKSSMVLRYNYELTQNEANKNKVVATGRFTIHKRNLHYSFYISDKAARPRSLQFNDAEGNILDEFVLSKGGGFVNSVYQNTTRKVCGVWKRLPKAYRSLLKDEKLFVTLVWGDRDSLREFSVSGQLKRYAALEKEIFSSLLEPAPGTNPQLMAGSGGTAMVSVSTTFSPSIHVAVIFNGIFTPNDIYNVPINITLSLEEKRDILVETIVLEKAATDLNLIEISTPVSNADLRLLTRGKLVLSVSSVSLPNDLRLSGNVIAKATCEYFQAILSSADSKTPNIHVTSGLAWLFLNNEGSLVYNIHVDNLKVGNTGVVITLVDDRTKSKPELEDLTPTFFKDWANGTLDKLSLKVFDPLYKGKLSVNVATEQSNSLISGHLVSKFVSDARDSPAPFLLRRENYTMPASVVGMAWLSVDDDCHFHYDVSLSGLDTQRNMELLLELMPQLAPGAPVKSRLLTVFKGKEVEGSPNDVLSREELDRLQNGVGFLKVKEKKDGVTLLMGTINQVEVPQSCYTPFANNDIDYGLPEDTGTAPIGNCFYENRYYGEETQWASSTNPCVMCFCQNGKVKCDTMTCPDPGCPESLQIPIPGECCPVCANLSMPNQHPDSMQKCNLNGQQITRGVKFRPFLIPSGFDNCIECVCTKEHLVINCSRQFNDRNCCQNCQKPLGDPDEAGDEPRPIVVPQRGYNKEVPTRSVEKVLSEGGCPNPKFPDKPYENGQEYHPYIDLLGEYVCVTCKCKDGKADCQRTKCDKVACTRLFKLKKAGNFKPSENCCNIKKCRKFKHKKVQITNNIS